MTFIHILNVTSSKLLSLIYQGYQDMVVKACLFSPGASLVEKFDDARGASVSNQGHAVVFAASKIADAQTCTNLHLFITKL